MVSILGFELNLPTESWVMIFIAFICYIFNATTSIAQLIYYSSDETQEKKYKDVISSGIFYFAYIGLVFSLVVMVASWTYLAWKWGRYSYVCASGPNDTQFNGWFSLFLLISALFSFGACFILWYYSIVDEYSKVKEVLEKFDAKSFVISTLVVGLVSIIFMFITSTKIRST
jgi:hypothetical protein